jgi:hypothetical protein
MTDPRQPPECPICHRRFASPTAQAAHVCALTEQFFRNAIPRWRAAGVVVLIAPTNYGRQAAREEQGG